MKTKILLSIFLLFIWSSFACADCVDLSSATSYTVSNMHNILLYKHGAPFALVKTFSFIYPGSNLQTLKTAFVCSYDSSVFLLDGNDLVDVTQVTRL